MLSWVVQNKSVYMYKKKDLALNNWKWLIYHKNHVVTVLFVYFSETFDFIPRGKIEQILLVYYLPKKNYYHYPDALQKHDSTLDGDTDILDIVAGDLHGDTLGPFLFIISLDYVRRTSVDRVKENGFMQKICMR